MATLVVVRHGQASLGADDYDVLSALGWRQSRALGRYWAENGEHFDGVFVGPRRRQRETLQGVGEGLEAEDRGWPRAEPLAEFDEHQAAEVVHHYSGQFEGREPEDPRERNRWFLKAFQRLSRQWVRGDLATPDHLEPWHTFRRRIDGALDGLMARSVPGGRHVVFTSGGVMAVAVGRALGLDDERVMELSWRIRNASYSRFLISGERFSLDTFNETPHLNDHQMLTMV